MRAIILAAGLGTRLGDLGRATPKSLVSLNGSTILGMQVKMLNKLSIRDISVVIGTVGDCWSNENQEKIKSIVNEVVINPKNTETKNTYSLRLALEGIGEDDLLVMDGDLILSLDLLKKIITYKKSLILSKESYLRDDTRYKIITDNGGRVLEIGKQLPEGKVPFPYSIYGALIRIERKDFDIFKGLIDDEKYCALDLVFFINDLCRKARIFKVTDSRWINVNKTEELEEAKKLCRENSLY